MYININIKKKVICQGLYTIQGDAAVFLQCKTKQFSYSARHSSFLTLNNPSIILTVQDNSSFLTVQDTSVFNSARHSSFLTVHDTAVFLQCKTKHFSYSARHISF